MEIGQADTIRLAAEERAKWQCSISQQLAHPGALDNQPALIG